MTFPIVQRALVSVSDKTGLVEFARRLVAAGVEIYSTGGTRKHLEAAGIAAREVAEYTGFPEMMDGRLKTLHPKIFGGILCRHDRDDDMQAIAAHGIASFELVVVNLYPFAQTAAKPGVTPAEAIEQIDIGGPSLVRAAAKNHAFTAIATSPAQYEAIAGEVEAHRATSLQLRKELAAAAFAHTAKYDAAIAEYFYGRLLSNDPADVELPPVKSVWLERSAVLRYGENPHQAAAVYGVAGACGIVSLLNAKQLNGKELSYNNLLDLDSALAIARSLPGEAAAAVIKHNNPCGAAVANTLAEATQKAMGGDPLSAFGSVLGMSRPVDAATAEVLCEPGLFVEAIAAPSFSPAAVELLTTKPKWRANVRLLEVGPLSSPPSPWSLRQIEGGFLLQQADVAVDPESEWQTVTNAAPTEEQLAELRFAWAIVRHVKSNAIAVTRGGALAGAGAGQMSRVDSVEIALAKAGERSAGGALASDAFFPFADSIPKAAAAGIAAIIQPGGSKNDAEVIAACNAHGLAMIFTGRRHFKH